MKLVSLVSAFILFLNTASAEIPCNEYFHPKHEVYTVYDELTYSNKINLWRKTNNIIRNFRGKTAEPAILTMINQKVLRLNDFVLNQNESIPVRELEILFEEVELSAVYLKKSVPLFNHLTELKNFEGSGEALVQLLKNKGVNQSMLEGIESKIDNLAGREEFLKDLQKSIKKKSRKLGSKLEEYVYTRKHFEKLLKDEGCNQECREFLQKYILSKIGVSSKSAKMKYPSLLTDVKGLSLDEVLDVLYVNHTSNVVRYRNEMFYETFAVLKRMMENRDKIEMIYRYMKSIPVLGKTKLFNFLLWAKNLNVLEKHFPQIDDLVLSAKTISQKMEDLKDLNKYKFSSKSDDFLVSFARKDDVSTKEVWDQIKTEASQKDIEFHTQMVSAEKLAEKEGPLSINYKPKLSQKLLFVLAGGGLVYFSFGLTQSDTEGVNSSKTEKEIPSNESNSNNLNNSGFQTVELTQEDEDEFEPLAHDTATVLSDPQAAKIINSN